MARPAIPTWFFTLVVVRMGHRFLVVRENKHQQQWYLPTGRVEQGEELIYAARRATYEKTGISIVIEGIVRIEHTPNESGSRVRFIFVARPIDDTPPKSTPDTHSLEAAWVSLDELRYLSLRGEEVRELFSYIADSGQIFPLDILAFEGQELPKRPSY